MPANYENQMYKNKMKLKKDVKNVNILFTRVGM